ncbi:hypothetical protein BS47DRAFT_1356555, partial [Hydnum rufescens UP504]
MAQIVSRNFYFIINRVLSPSGVKLAAQYNGPDNKVTLEPFDEANEKQRWVLDQSPEKYTTIVPLAARNEQAAPGNFHRDFVVTEVEATPYFWVLKGEGVGPLPLPLPLPENIRIEELGRPQPDHRLPDDHRRIWGAEKAVPGDEVTLKHDHHSFAQRWIFER